MGFQLYGEETVEEENKAVRGPFCSVKIILMPISLMLPLPYPSSYYD